MGMKVTVGGLGETIEFDNPDARITSESLAIVNQDGTETTVYEYDENTGLNDNEDLWTLVPVFPEKQSILPVRMARLASAALTGAFGAFIDRKDK